MPRHLFCRRFYFVSEKERKAKQSQSWPHLELFFAVVDLLGGFFFVGRVLGDSGPKQAAGQLVMI